MSSIHLSARPGLKPVARLYLQGIRVGPDLDLQEVADAGEYATDPAPGTPAGRYLVVFYDGLRKIASGLLDWDGAQEIAPATQTGLSDVSDAVQALGQPLQAQDYEAPANADIAAIKAKTDTLVNADLSGIALQQTAQEIKQLSVEIQTRVDAALGAPDSTGATT